MASKRARRRASCEGKIRHPSPKEARQHAYRLRAETGTKNYGFYKCQFCGGWHVGRRDNKLIKSAIAHATNQKLKKKFRWLLRRKA